MDDHLPCAPASADLVNANEADVNEDNASSALDPTLAKLRKSKIQARSKLTCLLKDLRTYYSQGPRCVSDDLAFAIHKVEEQILSLNSIESKLEELTHASDPSLSKYHAEVEELLFKSNRLLNRLDERDSSSSSSKSKSSRFAAPESVGLPKLSLSKFSGDPFEFRPFMDDFRSAVHDRDIPPVIKFQYLKSCLVSDAKGALDFIPTSAENYPRALAELRRRFGSPAVLISLYANRLVSLPATPDLDTSAFRSLLDQFESALSEIRQLKRELESDSAAGDSSHLPSRVASSSETREVDISELLLAPLLLNKLPLDVQLQWRPQSKSPLLQFDVDKLLLFARTELENLESIGKLSRCEETSLTRPSTAPQRVSPKPREHSSKPSRTTVAAFPSIDVHKPCPCCHASPGHSLLKCDTFKHIRTPQERYSFIKEHHRCVNCLGSHSTAACNSSHLCRNCSKKHHTLLCFRPSVAQATASVPDLSPSPRCQPGQRQSLPNTPVVSDPLLSTMSSTTSCVHKSSSSVFMKIASVFVTSPSSSQGYYVACLLDDGSKRSYIREDLARALDLPVATRSLLTTGSFGEHVESIDSALVSFSIQGSHGFKPAINLQAWTVPRLCPSMSQERLSEIPRPYASLFPWADTFDGGPRDVAILIGADLLWQVCSGELRRSPKLPVAIDTAFGWVLSGPLASQIPLPPVTHSEATPSFFINEPEPDLQRLWNLESLGIRDKADIDTSPPLPVFNGERYEVRLPFLDHRRPSSNHDLADRCLRSLVSRLSPEELEVYDGNIQSMMDKGVIEPASTPTSVGYFMPHHGVWRDKLRIVFNASAPARDGKSLNSFLDPGPNLFSLILDLLLRFRLFAHAIYGDLEAAFHSVALAPEDRQWVL